jgi:HK97 family phage prohead protease
VTSIHRRRLQIYREQATTRIINLAAREGLSVADLRNVQLPWYEIRNQVDAEDEPASVLIYDEIGGSLGVSSEQFAQDIAEITAPEIRVRINSPGGSVFVGIAIYNSLNHHPARIVVYVDSLAASIASVIAMAGDEIVMMPGSQLMIHDASAMEQGNASDMGKMATFLDRQSDNVADIYRMRAGGEVAKWRELLLAETWMFAQEAVDHGLADRIEQPPGADPDRELMSRTFDLGRFQYRGRRNAPEPGKGRVVRPRAATVVRERAATAPEATRGGAAQRRSAALRGASRPAPAQAPAGAARALPFAAQMQAERVERNGQSLYRLVGVASVTDTPYEMWDEFGPYDEVIERGAFADTLAADPDVAFLVNHRGVTMARRKPGVPDAEQTLLLRMGPDGLRSEAYVNPKRTDVSDLVVAVQDGNITEMSFAFMLQHGAWNADFTQFRVQKLDLHRGDVSAVNYGANPYTSIAARSREIMRDLDHLPAGAARAALDKLQHRVAPVMAPAPGPTGRSLTAVDAWLAAAQI